MFELISPFRNQAAVTGSVRHLASELVARSLYFQAQPMLTFCKYAAFAALAMLCEQARSENTVHFESLSPEFDRLVGPTPSYEYLATGEAKELGAHEGAVFLEHGSQSLRSPCLLFTTKPQDKAGDSVGNKVAQIKRVIIDGPRKGKVDTLFTSENLVNGATLGFDGRLYFCFQGGLETSASGIYRFSSLC